MLGTIAQAGGISPRARFRAPLRELVEQLLRRDEMSIERFELPDFDGPTSSAWKIIDFVARVEREWDTGGGTSFRHVNALGYDFGHGFLDARAALSRLLRDLL